MKCFFFFIFLSTHLLKLNLRLMVFWNCYARKANQFRVSPMEYWVQELFTHFNTLVKCAKELKKDLKGGFLNRIPFLRIYLRVNPDFCCRGMFLRYENKTWKCWKVLTHRRKWILENKGYYMVILNITLRRDVNSFGNKTLHQRSNFYEETSHQTYTEEGVYS